MNGLKHKHLFVILLAACSFFDGLSQTAVCGYKYRKRITFDYTKVSGSTDLTDFPVLIAITADNDLRTVGNAGDVEHNSGFDIIFTDDDGITILDHDLRSYTPSTGAMQCWVKVPLLRATQYTHIYMYYGNTAISTNQSSSNTWSNGFAGVWHFDNNITNSSPNGGLNGTNNGSTNTATAMFSSARNFVRASNQYVDVTPYNAAYDLNSSITVSAWIRLNSLNNDQKVAGNQNNSTGGWKFGVFSDNKIEFEIRTSGNTPFLSRSAAGGSVITTNTWYYAVGQYSDAGDFIRTYLNGSLDRNYSTAAVCGTSNGTMKIGREPFAANSAHWDGVIDELRVSNVVRSADWVATEYNNQSSPATFYTVSPEPKLWLGTTSGNWNTGSNWSGGSVPSSGQDVIIKNDVPARQPTLNVSPQIGGLWIYSGATLNMSTRTLSVEYDVLNCGTLMATTGRLVLNSVPGNVQSQSLGGDGTYNLTNLTVNNTFNPAPAVTLNKDVNVSAALTLVSGIVYTGSVNILALGNSATSSSGSSNSFVHGPMSKSGTANFVFPIGKGQEWRRMGIASISSGSDFRAEYFNTAFTNTSPVNNPLTNVSLVEFWQLDRLSGSGNARVSLYWENVSFSGINDCTDLTVARWTGATWTEHNATPVAGSTCNGAGTGTITTNGSVNAFSPFTFASRTAGAVNPLPVDLLDFGVVCMAEGVSVRWTTASERNNDAFIVERSPDGVYFELAGEKKGQGNSSRRSEYELTDAAPIPGISYYRLKQRDFDGKEKIFPITSVECNIKKEEIYVYPNPNSGIFSVRGLKSGETLSVYNSVGQLIMEKTAGDKELLIVLERKGVFLVRVPGKDKIQTKRVIVD